MGLAEIGVAGLIISAAGATASYVEAEKRSDIEEERRDTQAAQQDVEALAQRRKQIREQKIRAAQIAQATEATKTGGSSGEAGVQGALATNVMANVATGSGRSSFGRTMGGLAQKTADSQMRSTLWGAAGDLGGAMFSTAMSDEGTKKKFYSLFE